MAYKIEQRRVAYRGRSFHFVSYQGKGTSPSMWFLMSAGTRWEVMEQVPGQDAADLDRRLLEWLERTIN